MNAPDLIAGTALATISSPHGSAIITMLSPQSTCSLYLPDQMTNSYGNYTIVLILLSHLYVKNKQNLCLQAVHRPGKAAMNLDKKNDTLIMDEFTEKLKSRLIEILNLTDVRPEDIDENAQLVGGELGIDSIDVLEMVVMVEKEYGIVINNKDIGEKVFSTLTALADYIRAHSPGVSSPASSS